MSGSKAASALRSAVHSNFEISTSFSVKLSGVSVVGLVHCTGILESQRNGGSSKASTGKDSNWTTSTVWQITNTSGHQV